MRRNPVAPFILSMFKYVMEKELLTAKLEEVEVLHLGPQIFWICHAVIGNLQKKDPAMSHLSWESEECIMLFSNLLKCPSPMLTHLESFQRRSHTEGMHWIVEFHPYQVYVLVLK